MMFLIEAPATILFFACHFVAACGLMLANALAIDWVWRRIRRKLP